MEARDHATSTFKKVGDGAHGLGDRLKALDSIAEAGHGFKKALRTIHHMALAFEVLPVAMDAAGAAWTSLQAVFDSTKYGEAIAAQTELKNSLKEIPVIGKLAGKVSDWGGDKIAHLFGKQTTAEAQAEIDEQKKALTDFATEAPKIRANLMKHNNEAALVGLSPTAAQAEKAKQAYRETMEGIFDQRSVPYRAVSELNRQIEEQKQKKTQYIHKMGGGFDYEAERERDEEADRQIARLESQKTAAQIKLDELTKIEQAAAKVRDFAIAESNAKQLVEQREFSAKFVEIETERVQKLQSLTVNSQAKLYEIYNRAYEGRVVLARAALAQELTTIEEGADKQIAALENQRSLLKPRIDAGDADARKKSDEITDTLDKVQRNKHAQLGVAKTGGANAAYLDRENQLRQETLSILGREEQSGNLLAKLTIERLNTAREQEATEKALQAISRDASATEAQRVAANKQLVELKYAQRYATERELELSSTSILEKQAEAGDTGAAYQAKQVQLSRERLELEIRLRDIKEHGNTEQFIAANQQIEALEKLRFIQTGNDVRDSGLFLLQQEATLGDKVAEKELRKLEIQKQFTAEKQKLIALITTEGANDKQRADARKLLSNLDAVEKRAEQQLGSPEKQQGLASLVEGNMLTGVQASLSQEQSQYAPIVDAADKHRAVSENIRDMMRDYVLPFMQGMKGMKDQQTVEVK